MAVYIFMPEFGKNVEIMMLYVSSSKVGYNFR